MLSTTRAVNRKSNPSRPSEPDRRQSQPTAPQSYSGRPDPRKPVSPQRREQDDDGTWHSGPSRRGYLHPPAERDDSEAWDSGPARRGNLPGGESWGSGPRRPRERIIGKHEAQEEFRFEGHVQAFLEQMHELLNTITTESQAFQSKVNTGKPSRPLKDRELDELSMMRTDMIVHFLGMCVAWQGMYIPNSAKRPENGTVNPAPPGSSKPSGKDQADPVDQGEKAAGRQESESRQPPDYDEPGRSSQDVSKNEAVINKLRKQIKENTEILASLREDDDMDSRLLARRYEHWDTLRRDLLKQTDKKTPKSQDIERDFVTATRSYSEQLEKVCKILEAMTGYYENEVSLFENLETTSGRSFKDEKEQANENKKKCMQRIADMQKSLSEVKTASEKTGETGAAEDAEEKLEGSLFDVLRTGGEVVADVKRHEPVPEQALEAVDDALEEVHAAMQDLSLIVSGTAFRASEIPESMAGRLRDLQRDHPELYKAWLRASTGAKPTSRHAPYTSPEP